MVVQLLKTGDAYAGKAIKSEFIEMMPFDLDGFIPLRHSATAL